jgi:DNA polymerase-3 subunit epsilon
MTTFVAIDFETANTSPDSACAIGLVVVQGNRIARREHYLIRPPDRQFVFTYLHGIAWKDVRDAPTFHELWPTLEALTAGADFLAAHNASFDRRVLDSCCRTYRLSRSAREFVCTVKLARTLWGLYPTRLPDVCRHLNIPLRHHQADSDAEACARIVIAARKAGWRKETMSPGSPRVIGA